MDDVRLNFSPLCAMSIGTTRVHRVARTKIVSILSRSGQLEYPGPQVASRFLLPGHAYLFAWLEVAGLKVGIGLKSAGVIDISSSATKYARYAGEKIMMNCQPNLFKCPS